MKLISFISSIFLAQSLFSVSAKPLPQLQLPQLPDVRPEAITTQSMNNGLAFTQNMLQLLGMLFNNFNAFVPRFVSLFTSQNPPAGANPTGLTLPSMPSIPGLTMPSILPAGFNNRMQPEKINNELTNVPSNTPKKDVEPIEYGNVEDIDKISI